MKSSIYQRLSMLAAVGILAACSATTPEDNKQAKLDKLKKEQAGLAKEVLKLEEEIAKENPGAAVKAKAKDVSVTEIAPRKFDHYVQTQGSVEAEYNVPVSAKSAGVITQVFVNEGQQVSKGQVLAQIDNSVIVRNIEGMKSRLELANSIYDRQKNLWDQKIGTEVQFLQAKSNKESLEKELASLQEQSDMARIKSPISGTVEEVSIKPGENIAPGMPAIRVVNTSDLKLVANVSEAYVTAIKTGNRVIINIPELKKEITAKVTFVGKTIDQLSRTFPVEVKLSSNADLRPNMTGILKVVFHSEPAAIVVPINVVQEVNKEKVVYVVESNGKQTVARKRVVTIEGVYDNLAQVTGLKAGDKVITFGYQGLNDGQIIKI